MRPTISLCLIAKNEEKNVPVLFESIRDCFDEIVFTDTGSTDKTIEVAKEWAAKIGVKISFYNFEWVKDFSKARNFGLEKVTTDFAMWMDLDDSLGNREAFINWRNEAMAFGDYWLAKYHYALNEHGKPIIQFLRERVLKMSFNPRFRYFIHEGVQIVQGMRANVINTWWIDHRRTKEEMEQDHGRNLEIIEPRKEELDGRLWFYFGKELYENKKMERALSALMTACARTDLEFHDRILAMQYACYASMSVADMMKPEFQADKLTHTINLAQKGLLLDPTRAEFHVLIGECYIKQGNLRAAAPYFSAAKACIGANHGGSFHAGPIFTYRQCYEDIPRVNLAKIYFQAGLIDEAEREIKECLEKYPSDESRLLLEEFNRVKPLITLDGKKAPTEDIVFSTPPQTAYEFSSETYKTSGLGGSETALVEMATWLKKLTDRPVKVFAMRENDFVDENGVEWLSNKNLNAYMCRNMPTANIQWRHNVKISNAPTFLWCHDLVCPGVDQVNNFDYIMVLSEFHRKYVTAMQGVSPSKIITTRNGIDPEKFKFERPVKNSNKIVWMSSPDRGLDRTIKVLDIVRKEFPDIELHIFYGMSNLRKYGLADLADKLDKMIAERPWIKYHGFTEQKKMYEMVADAVIWLHCCDFIESFCITALEMLSLGIYPVTRKLGALQNTLAKAEADGNAILLEHDCVTDSEFLAYAEATKKVLREKSWEKVIYDPEQWSWRGVAEEWLEFLPLMKEVKSEAV